MRCCIWKTLKTRWPYIERVLLPLSKNLKQKKNIITFQVRKLWTSEIFRRCLLGFVLANTVKFCGKFETQWERIPIHRLLDTLYPMPRARNKKDIFVPLEN